MRSRRTPSARTRTLPFPAGDDPLRLDLPTPRAGIGGSHRTPAAVRVFASMYLAAELEQAGVVPIAELLSAQRDTVNLTSPTRRHRSSTPSPRASTNGKTAPGRVQLYARLFGIGPGATNDTGALTTVSSSRCSLSLCRALAVYARISPGAGSSRGSKRRSRSLRTMLLAEHRVALRSVTPLLAARPHRRPGAVRGSTSCATRRSCALVVRARCSRRSSTSSATTPPTCSVCSTQALPDRG